MRKTFVRTMDWGSVYNLTADVEVKLVYGDYVVKLPLNQVFQKNKNGERRLLLRPGDKFTILYNHYGIEVAYLYNKNIYINDLPGQPKEFIRTMPWRDRIVFAHALRKKILDMKKIPSLQTYKNLETVRSQSLNQKHNFVR